MGFTVTWKSVLAFQPGGSNRFHAPLSFTDHYITVAIVFVFVGVTCPIQQFNTVNLLWVGIRLEVELAGVEGGRVAAPRRPWVLQPVGRLAANSADFRPSTMLWVKRLLPTVPRKCIPSVPRLAGRPNKACLWESVVVVREGWPTTVILWARGEARGEVVTRPLRAVL